MFYWMRLFKTTAFFMNLLWKTIKGILTFLMVLLLLLLTLTNLIFIMDKIDHDVDHIDPKTGSMSRIITDHVGNDFLNSAIHMYLLSLGEFDFDDYSKRGTISNICLWIIFIFGTFMLQITFMNMLIAIMAETFAEVTEKRQQSSLTERIMLLNDFRVFLDLRHLKKEA